MDRRGVRVVEASVTFEEYALRSPLVLTGGTIEDVTEAQATVTIADAAGRQASGRGTVFLSAIWAWPQSELGFIERVDAMQQMCIEVSDFMPALCDDADHPLGHGMRLEDWADGHRVAVGLRLFIRERIPKLAALVCLSPFDAALHDAYGRLHERSSYETLSREFTGEDLSRWLGPVGEGRYLDEFVHPRGRETLDAWLVIGTNDALRERDAEELGDGLPCSVEKWIERCGYRRFKLKVKGADPVAEAQWVASVYEEVAAIRAELGLGADASYLVDSNEGCDGPAVVLEFLDELERASADAYAALDYIEQPTERDLNANRWDMREIAARKPVFVDESVEDLAALEQAVELGWTGPALKTCKGHSAALLEIAWCHLTGHPYTLQDLTNPNIAAVQAAGLAAHCDTRNGVELNVMQFVPASSRATAAEFPGLLRVRDGVHRVDDLAGVGLA
jgi:L-alanine-DL-glutamate epimerase-like enolase superfamily enzyme